jgi:hypothetical protein
MSDNSPAEFSGNSWEDNSDGTYTMEGNSGEYLHSDRSESNNARDSNHVHTYPNGEYSMKENGHNVFGNNEANSTTHTQSNGCFYFLRSCNLTYNIRIFLIFPS